MYQISQFNDGEEMLPSEYYLEAEMNMVRHKKTVFEDIGHETQVGDELGN